ncbi:MAG: GlxA family transcriptional regulator, partial [Mesorhizobium sp.]
MTRSEAPSIFTQSAQPLRLTFLVFSGCSIMCVAAAVDPLRAANRIAGRTVFDWTLVSADGAPAMTTSGLPVAVSGRIDANARMDVLVAIGGFGTRYETATSLVAGFRRAAKAARAVGGIEAGAWLL